MILLQCVGAVLGVSAGSMFAPNWSVGVEYDPLWMGHGGRIFAGAGVITPSGTATIIGDRLNQNVDMVTVRFN